MGDPRKFQVWVVETQNAPAFFAGKPKLLFELPRLGGGSPIRCWDVSPDAERFLMVQREEREPQRLTEFVLVQNWFEEVRRLAPTGRK